MCNPIGGLHFLLALVVFEAKHWHVDQVLVLLIIMLFSFCQIWWLQVLGKTTKYHYG